MASELADDKFKMQQICDQGHWRLLFANTKVEGAGHGFVDAAELEWLRETLDQSSEQSILLAMHHTPLRLCAFVFLSAS